MNAYIDIDGVLLTKRQEVPLGAEELIRFLLDHFDCHWLTTHCRHGENHSLRYLGYFYSPETLTLLNEVKPTRWNSLKTEAIDFDTPFIWLEDAPFESEREVLRSYKAEESLVWVQLARDWELQRVMELLRHRL